MNGLILGPEASVHCMTFRNPNSANGPFGEIKIVSANDAQITGCMTLILSLGLPQKAVMNLIGSCTGESAQLCQMQAVGYVSQLGNPPHKIQMEVTLTMDHSWMRGDVTFSQDLPDVVGGLPVIGVPCA